MQSTAVPAAPPDLKIEWIERDDANVLFWLQLETLNNGLCSFSSVVSNFTLLAPALYKLEEIITIKIKGDRVNSSVKKKFKSLNKKKKELFFNLFFNQ